MSFFLIFNNKWVTKIRQGFGTDPASTLSIVISVPKVKVSESLQNCWQWHSHYFVSSLKIKVGKRQSHEAHTSTTHKELYL
jgi:hypothetical protein